MKKNNGITLIALIITIVVLLILAVISINVTVGDDGIISSGVVAQEEAEISSEKEAVETASIHAMGANSYAIIEKDALQDQLDVITGEGKTEVYGESSVLLIVKFLETERLYEVDTLGNVTELEPTDESIFTITEDGVLSLGDEYSYYIDYDDRGKYTVNNEGYTSGSSKWTDEYLIIPTTVDGITVTALDDYFLSISNVDSTLKYVVLPDTITTIGNYAFWRCYSLTVVNMPTSLTTIGNYAFCSCGNLTGINIPDCVNSIGQYAFSNCSSLTEINIPDNLTSIEQGAFMNCSGVTVIDIPEGVTSIGSYAFRYSSITTINIPNSVVSIDEYAFFYCKSLTEINIPDSVASMGSYVFKNCTSLTTINCEAESQPSGWNSSWNGSSATVNWGVSF